MHNAVRNVSVWLAVAVAAAAAGGAWLRCCRQQPVQRCVLTTWPPPAVTHTHLQDARANWICNPVHKHRELRGLTSAGKKYRGLQGKGHNYAKARPSVRATWRRNQNPSLRRYR